MNCEEFQMAGLDLGTSGEEGLHQQAAREHLKQCPHCAALHESWQALRTDLRAVGAHTQSAETPSRVELRLRQEFRLRHKVPARRRTALVAAWALAAVALLAVTVTWISWRKSGGTTAANHPVVSVPSSSGHSASSVTPAGPELGEVLLASNNSGEFTLLPGTMPGTMGDATVVHVQMQRAALGALGLTVNEENASDWIQVDLLVGDDGQPQAVRLPEATN